MPENVINILTVVLVLFYSMFAKKSAVQTSSIINKKLKTSELDIDIVPFWWDM